MNDDVKQTVTAAFTDCRNVYRSMSKHCVVFVSKHCRGPISLFRIVFNAFNCSTNTVTVRPHSI